MFKNLKRLKRNSLLGENNEEGAGVGEGDCYQCNRDSGFVKMTPSIPILPLSEVCEVNPRNVNGLDLDTLVTFVPMSAVDERTGSIVAPEIRRYQEVAKGYTPFKDKDVLFAKITPCMENGKCAIASGLENGWGFGSTEFHILRASDKVIPEWVYYFIRQEEVRKFAANNMTGTAGQQRVPKSVFDRLFIPLPPLPIQKQIAAILEKADAAREKRRQANQLTEQFLQSAFLEMFGDPVTNPKGWVHHELTEVCDKITDGTHDTPERVEAGLKFITGKNIRPFRIDFTQLEFVTEEVHKEIFERCNPIYGDVLYTNIGANVGTAVMNYLNEEFSMKNVALLKHSRSILASRYLEHVLNNPSMKSAILKRFSIGGAQSFLSLANIKRISIPIPPPALQQKFALLVEKVELLREKQRESEKELENLFGSLMQRAFKGELVS